MLDKYSTQDTQGARRRAAPEFYMPAMPPVAMLDKLDTRLRAWVRGVREKNGGGSGLARERPAKPAGIPETFE